jgi:hypothetical protein
MSDLDPPRRRTVGAERDADGGTPTSDSLRPSRSSPPRRAATPRECRRSSWLATPWRSPRAPTSPSPRPPLEALGPPSHGGRARSTGRAPSSSDARGAAVLRAARIGSGARGQRERAYDVWLESLAPLSGSCACADYGKAGLGLCKHLFAVIAPLVASPAGSRRRQGSATPPTSQGRRPPRRLSASTGRGCAGIRCDRSRVRVTGSIASAGSLVPRRRADRRPARVVALFTAAPEAGGSGLRRLALPRGRSRRAPHGRRDLARVDRAPATRGPPSRPWRRSCAPSATSSRGPMRRWRRAR